MRWMTLMCLPHDLYHPGDLNGFHVSSRCEWPFTVSWHFHFHYHPAASRTYVPPSWIAAWCCAKEINKELRSANVFYCTFTKQQEYKKFSPQTFFFFVCFRGSICKFFLTIAANSSSDKQREGTREELEGVTIKLSESLSVRRQHITAGGKKKGTRKSMTFLADYVGARIGGAGVGICTFWLFLTTLLNQRTHFVLHCFCCFAITTRECNSS